MRIRIRIRITAGNTMYNYDSCYMCVAWIFQGAEV